MQRLAHTDELLDGPLDDERDLRGNLRDLRRVNRLLGGSRLSRLALEPLLGATRAASFIDVGTGAADIPMDLADAARRRGCDLRIVAVDSRPEVLSAARALDSRLEKRAAAGLETRPGGDPAIAPPSIALGVADGRRLPWADGAFDVAHASLVLHHLEPGEAVSFLAELRRVSRRGVIVNDLVRGRHWWALAWLGTRLLTRNPLTRNDAPLSVRRAYTVGEAAELLRRAGLEPVFVAMGLLGHRFAIAATPALPPTRSAPAATAAVPAASGTHERNGR